MDFLATIQDRTYERVTDATKSSWPPDRRMSADDLAAVAERRRYVVVASARPDGRPHVAPSGFVAVSGAVWLPTMAGAVRRRNVATQPQVALSLCEGDGDSHGWLVIEGPAREVMQPPTEVVTAYEAKYQQSAGWAGCWLAVDPDRVLSYRGAAWQRP